VNESRVMTFLFQGQCGFAAEKRESGQKVGGGARCASWRPRASRMKMFLRIFWRPRISASETKIRSFAGERRDHDKSADISIWADQNDIKAGRGSRSAVSATSKITLDDGTSFIEPPAVGSGIRAATVGYGSAEAGNIHLFAPEGVIDAGEAEISGGKITMAAQTVVNVQNIVSTSGTVGVSGTTASTASLGSLSGAGSVAQNSQLLSSASGLGAAGAANAAQMIDDVMTQWLDVKSYRLHYQR